MDATERTSVGLLVNNYTQVNTVTEKHYHPEQLRLVTDKYTEYRNGQDRIRTRRR